jgi:creatinine amidohydrolase
MVSTKRIQSWADLTTSELPGLVEQDPLAVLVLGAIEQHGPHLPLSTDLVIGKGLCDAALQKLDPPRPVLVLPALALGASEEHTGFAGTLSLSARQMLDQIEAVGASLARAGVRRLMLLNAHGGNVSAMSMAALSLRKNSGLLVVKANYMAMPPPAGLLAAGELQRGLHGGQAETAMMMALAGDLVRIDKRADFETRPGQSMRLGADGDASWAWLAEDLNPDGVVGAANLATIEQGQQLIDHYAGRLAEVMRQALAMRWPPEQDR